MLGREGYEIRECEGVRVGEVMRISKEEVVPCDMVILQTSDGKGRSYVETSNLDGEIHHKTKKIVHSTKLQIKNLSSVELYN